MQLNSKRSMASFDLHPTLAFLTLISCTILWDFVNNKIVIYQTLKCDTFPFQLLSRYKLYHPLVFCVKSDKMSHVRDTQIFLT
jgi:hypothetical protein